MHITHRKRFISRDLVALAARSPQELAAVYTAADVFVNLTHEENYPTVNLEARACGTPVITYDTGGCRETLDGLCAAVVNTDCLRKQGKN